MPVDLKTGVLILDELIEKRKNPRVEVRWPIKLSNVEKTIEGETINISSDGISLCCDDPLALNAIFNISIMPLNQSMIEIKGKVVWSDCYGIEDDTTYGIGICFVEISDEDQKKFDELLSIFIQ